MHTCENGLADVLDASSTSAGQADPYPLYRQLLAAGPVRGGPDGAWYVFGYQACRRVLGDRGCRVPAGHQTAGRLQASMVMHDPPEHARLRRAISWAFTPAEVHRLCDRIVATEAGFVAGALARPVGSHVLDLCCGIGRHSRALARLGLRVSGLDAVVNMYSSFGFLETEGEDERVVAEIAGALKPGGRFFLDMSNPLWLFRNYHPQVWAELPDRTVLLEKQVYEVRSGRVVATWRLIRPDGRSDDIHFSMRAYTLPELVTCCTAAASSRSTSGAGSTGVPTASTACV